jgi:rhamnosyltransferase
MLIACIVTYNPSQEQLAKLVLALELQTDGILILDNGGAAKALPAVEGNSGRYELIGMGGNVGIATALNHGVRRATELGADYVALFDQDSLPSEGMLANLVSAFDGVEATGGKVAVVGPCCIDYRHTPAKPVPALRRDHFWPRTVNCLPDQRYLGTDFVITSGSVISLHALRQVGGFEDRLFVSYVDVEWCLRARNKGFTAYIDCATEMRHEFGEADQKRLLGKTVIPYRPIRYFYQTQSWVLLLSFRHIPFGWKLKITYWVLAQILALMLTPNRESLNKLWHSVRGVLSGIRSCWTGSRPVHH